MRYPAFPVIKWMCSLIVTLQEYLLPVARPRSQDILPCVSPVVIAPKEPALGLAYASIKHHRTPPGIPSRPSVNLLASSASQKRGWQAPKNYQCGKRGHTQALTIGDYWRERGTGYITGCTNANQAIEPQLKRTHDGRTSSLLLRYNSELCKAMLAQSKQQHVGVYVCVCVCTSALVKGTPAGQLHLRVPPAGDSSTRKYKL